MMRACDRSRLHPGKHGSHATPSCNVAFFTDVLGWPDAATHASCLRASGHRRRSPCASNPTLRDPSTLEDLAELEAVALWECVT